ncbi:MAG: peptidylprolyl isomerase [Phycisphaerae bacterium]|jgi:peptidyl-prolyl cis-trans isomerase B (cyclophilin B)|nr:peptidylprolyl isomerase [Phycisphaerae bacterium]
MRSTLLPFALTLGLVASLATSQTPATAPAATPPSPTLPAGQPTASPEAPTAPPAEKRPSAKKRTKDVKDVTGTILTDGHEVKFELYVHKAPTLCANFVHLAKRDFWNGMKWHGFTRVIRQAGLNLIGYKLPREFAPDLNFDDPAGGLLCYPKVSDKSSDAANGVRFFITIKNQERWNLDFQIFGKVTSGLEHIVALSEGATIEKITIDGDADNLLKQFDVEITQWNEWLTREGRARQLPPGTIEGTPDRRTGEVIPLRELDSKPTGPQPPAEKPTTGSPETQPK